MEKEFLVCKKGSKKRMHPDEIEAQATIEPKVLIKGMFRCIEPYPSCFQTNCKKRWIGSTITHIFTSEFKFFTAEYYAH